MVYSFRKSDRSDDKVFKHPKFEKKKIKKDARFQSQNLHLSC